MNSDNNTKFFYTEVRVRKQRNSIISIKTPNGTSNIDPDLIMAYGISFFKQLWNSKFVAYFSNFPYFNPSISLEENKILVSIPSKDEIKRVVWSMPNFKSPRPDGFGPSFYCSA